MHETTGTGRLKAIREAAAEVVEIGGDQDHSDERLWDAIEGLRVAVLADSDAATERASRTLGASPMSAATPTVLATS